MFFVYWLKNAFFIKEAYGGYVDYEEGFYICPECGEPIYNDDWGDIDFFNYVCPICEWFEEDF